MALSKLAANSFDLTDNYALTGTVTGVTSTQKIFLIKNIDASSSSTVSFVDGSSSVVLDNTYKTYLFKFVNIHPETDAKRLGFQCSTDGGSSYGVTTTTTHFIGYHREDGSASELSYKTANDLAQSTDFIQFEKCGNDNDQCLSGILKLYNPSSTTFVKHFLGVSSNAHEYPAALNAYIAGYFNTTSAINAVQFKFDSGEIQGGTIDLFGVV